MTTSAETVETAPVEETIRAAAEGVVGAAYNLIGSLDALTTELQRLRKELQEHRAKASQSLLPLAGGER